ncbi:MAG: BolA family transcriptional regulator [Ottowia sp.]|nr:BolA family transcriptional regulator [Ottowia sp.]
MVISAEEIAQRLQDALQPTHLVVDDEGSLHVGHANAGTGHFRVQIVADYFCGHDRVARHRIVYAILRDLIGAGVHALSLETLTPEEFL